MRRLVLVLALLALVPALASCGKKPSVLHAPQGDENDTFPRTYPST
jgi:hypothetical protein